MVSEGIQVSNAFSHVVLGRLFGLRDGGVSGELPVRSPVRLLEHTALT